MMNENEAQAMVILRIAGNVYDALQADCRAEAEEQAAWLVSALLLYRLVDGIVGHLAAALGLPVEEVREALEDAAARGTGVDDEDDPCE